jgi:hypothetical protein
LLGRPANVAAALRLSYVTIAAAALLMASALAIEATRIAVRHRFG